ncbi:MAG TPA: hypothetical protein VIP70_04265 [Nitrososphaeraceae archaeon]
MNIPYIWVYYAIVECIVKYILQAKLFQDTANYFYYEKHILQKPNIQELARWCIKHAANANRDLVIQAKQVRQQQLLQQIKQQQMWQKQQLSTENP